MKTEQMELMKRIKKGATVWGTADATAIRELQKIHPDWMDIISNLKELEKITGEKYDGAKTCPYFGVILTNEGKEALAKAGT